MQVLHTIATALGTTLAKERKAWTGPKATQGPIGNFDSSIGPGKGPDALLPLPDSKKRPRIEVGFTYALQPASETGAWAA